MRLIALGLELIESIHAETVNRSGAILAGYSRVKVPENVQFDGQLLEDVLTGHSERSRNEPLFFRWPPVRDANSGVKNLPDLAVRQGERKLLCEYDGIIADFTILQTQPNI